MRKIPLFAAIAAAAAAPASAQNFEGLRAELRGGFDRVELSASALGDDVSGGENGFGYGVEFGFDKKVGSNVILGAYVGGDLSSVGSCSEVFGLDEACLEAGRNLQIGARVGVTASEKIMVYGKAGYSNGRIDFSYNDFENILTDFEDNIDRDGFHVGAGVEAALSKRFFLKAEYVFTSYNGAEFDLGADEFSIDGNRHQALLGVGLRF